MSVQRVELDRVRVVGPVTEDDDRAVVVMADRVLEPMHDAVERRVKW